MGRQIPHGRDLDFLGSVFGGVDGPDRAGQMPLNALELVLLRVRWRFGPARGLVLQRREQGLQGPGFPLVVLLPGDAQGLGRRRGRHLAGADLQDQFRPLSGFGIHLAHFCRIGRRVGNLVLLELLEPMRQAAQAVLTWLALEQLLQARTEGFAPGQIDSGFQGLEHALHRPVLPVVEGDPGHLQLPTHFRGTAPVGPDRKHGLGFLLGRVAGAGQRGAFGFGIV